MVVEAIDDADVHRDASSPGRFTRLGVAFALAATVTGTSSDMRPTPAERVDVSVSTESDYSPTIRSVEPRLVTEMATSSTSDVELQSPASLFSRWQRENQEIPEIDMAEDLESSLTNRDRWVIENFNRIMHQQAVDQYVRARPAQGTQFIDMEDGSREIILSQHVPLPAHEALRYWDDLGRALMRWIRTQPLPLQKVANERIAVRVDWDVEI